jgi:peptidoglycan/LPS O-acetylase OafA/YrhL
LSRAGFSVPKLAYLPGLDGVRAIAIIAVLFYHGGVTWLPGGFLGVDIFFVLSGYLITSILLGELSQGNGIDFKKFYNGRARRLVPAFLLMAFVVVTYAAFFMKDAVATTWRDLPWALFGSSNWFYVFHAQNYFEAMGRPLLLQHTWSLAVEVQFYLIWPLVLLFVAPRFGLAGVRWLAISCACVSFGIMYWLSTPFDTASSVSLSHTYFGTDSHSLGLFLGAALATLPIASAPRNEQIPKGLSVVLILHTVNESTGNLYQFGFPLASLMAVFLIALGSHPGLTVGRYLGVLPLRWIGERSYGMYLWHWPIFQATRPGIDLALTGIPALLFRLFLVIIIADLSYRFVEMPVRRGGLKRLWQRARTWNPATLRWAAAGAFGLVIAVGAGEAKLAMGAINANNASLLPYMTPVNLEPRIAMSAHPGAHRHHHSKRAEHLGPERLALLTPAMLLGDSVLLGTSPYIAHRVNVFRVDAVVARQADATLTRVTELEEAGKLPPTMILDLGNNGTVEESQLRSMLRLLRGCKSVVVINARVPRPWQDDNDALMARIVPKFSNAVLANWYAASAGRPDFFGPDGVHPTQAGARVYADVVASAVISAATRNKRLAVLKR